MKMILRLLSAALALMLAVPLFGACSYVNDLTDAYTQMFQEADKQSGSEESAYDVTSEGADEFDALLARFADNGFVSVEWEEADPIFLGGARRVVSLGEEGLSVNVFVYPTADDAAHDASCFSADGSSYNTTDNGVDISWAGDPHLYLSGRMIILYVGSDSEFISRLTDMFGAQFAGK